MADVFNIYGKKYPVWVHFEDEKENGMSFSSNPIIHHISAEGENKTQYKAVSNGSLNSLYDDREALIEENNIIPQLLLTKRNIMIAGGLMTFNNEIDEAGKRKVVEVDIEEITDQLDEMEENDVWEDASDDFVKHSIAYGLFQKQANGKWQLSIIKARYVMPEEMNDAGIVEKYFVSGNWKKQSEFPVKKVYSYAYYKSQKDNKKPDSFIKKISDDFLGNEYHPIPVWTTGSKWIEGGNKIPLYFNEFMKNANFAAMHISIPKDYFFDATALSQGLEAEKKARKEEAEKRKQFLSDVEKVMSGAQNAGKTFWTEYFISAMQKEYGGVKFDVITGAKPDEGILKLYEKTTEALISGTGVHPSLAAIITEGGLSSGSEIRNALDMFIITQIVILRKQVLKLAYILKRLNGWDKKIKFNFRDVQLTTTDANPTGSQAVTTN